ELEVQVLPDGSSLGLHALEEERSPVLDVIRRDQHVGKRLAQLAAGEVAGKNFLASGNRVLRTNELAKQAAETGRAWNSLLPRALVDGEKVSGRILWPVRRRRIRFGQTKCDNP